jgi:hypothetical protein
LAGLTRSSRTTTIERHAVRHNDDDRQADEPIDELLVERRGQRHEPWHAVFDIPVALILTIAVQSAGAIWWASGVTSKLDRAIEQIQEYKVDRYTKEDGRRDQALLFQMLEGLRQSDRDLERRVLNCEQAMFDSGDRNGKRK